jgi:hypothetical protein
MTHPLDEARAKLDRVFVHLKELDHEVGTFANAHPYNSVLDFDSEAPNIVIRAKAAVPDEPVPLLVGVIVGDVLNNLRSALEYVAWQLAIIGKGPDKDTHFPICQTPDHWRDWGAKYVSRLRREHAALIERMQPYNGRNGLVLLAAARLNNTDKHALISSVTWTAVYKPPKVISGIRKLQIKYTDGGVPLYDGAPTARITTLELIPGAQMNVEGPISYTVVFADPSSPGVYASYAALRRGAIYVRRIIRMFDAAFV